MRITFLGADHEVTGSCHYLQVADKNILIDCGMEQGNDVYENQELPIPACDVDYVLLTHAHIDHSGLIPLLYVNGFRGKIYCTEATVQLCDIMLRDSAHIQMFEAEWRNRKAKRSNGTLKEFIPLYDAKAVYEVMKQFVGLEYEKIVKIDDNVSIRLRDVGHLLGSASIEVWASEDTPEGRVERKLVFSGDIGNVHKPITKDPATVADADYVVMESTYGNRSHNGTPDYVAELVKVFKRTFDRGGNVVIPSFAVGRTQELLYHIRKIKADGLMDRDFDVYVDSPLAIEATEVFSKNVEQCFDEDAIELVRQGINPLSFPGLKYAISSEESKMINFDTNPKVIISASGMCEAGRIRHHLKHNLWREECSVVFAGYQAEGTLGRLLQDGTPAVKIFGEEIDVKAHIETLDGISGHADRDGLLTWAAAFEQKPKYVFVVHGNDESCESLTDALTTQLGLTAKAPYSGSEFDLIRGLWIRETEPVLVEAETQATRKATGIYTRLVDAGQMLMDVIARNQGGANQDLTRFTEQILALCEKWNR
mgnify:CR=1 FL=1